MFRSSRTFSPDQLHLQLPETITRNTITLFPTHLRLWEYLWRWFAKLIRSPDVCHKRKTAPSDKCAVADVFSKVSWWNIRTVLLFRAHPETQPVQKLDDLSSFPGNGPSHSSCCLLLFAPVVLPGLGYSTLFRLLLHQFSFCFSMQSGFDWLSNPSEKSCSEDSGGAGPVLWCAPQQPNWLLTKWDASLKELFPKAFSISGSLCSNPLFKTSECRS